MGYLLCGNLIGPARSGELFAEAIACTRRSGDQFMTYILHNNAGVRALRAADIPAAGSHLETAAQAMPATGGNSANLSVNMGWVLRQESDPDGARQCSQPPCGQLAGTGTAPTSPAPASAWRAWPQTGAMGAGQLSCTASRRPF
jgi:hypothetical protein